MRTKMNNLIGKTVMSKEGFIIGKIKDIQKNHKLKGIKTTLIKPSKKINLHSFKLNKQGDIVLPYKQLTKVRNIFVFEDLDQINKKLETPLK